MPKNTCFLLFSLVVQWALFNRFGGMVAMFLLPSVFHRITSLQLHVTPFVFHFNTVWSDFKRQDADFKFEIHLEKFVSFFSFKNFANELERAVDKYIGHFPSSLPPVYLLYPRPKTASSGMQSKCDDCERFKRLGRQAVTPEHAEAVRREYLEHVK